MRYLLLLAAALRILTVSAQNKQITVKDIWKNNTFKIKTVPGFNAMKDGKRYTQIDKDSTGVRINSYDLQSGKKLEQLYDNNVNIPVDGANIQVEDYEFSADENRMLLKTEGEHIYRHSKLNMVFVFDIRTNTIRPLDEEKVLHATFSPDGSKVAFVKDNNLYYKDLSINKTFAVTTDGKKNSIINGNCDWVYEEEFSFTRAFQWSPSGNYLAYYRFDETKVPEYIFPIYNGLYPTNYTYKYPKAGEPNSTIQIRLYDLNSKKTVDADLGAETDIYIPRIKWAPHSERLCIYRLNRLQNKLELMLANTADGKTELIYVESNPYYIEINDDLVFLPGGDAFVFTSERDGYTHLYHRDWKKNTIAELTKGNYDVDNIVGVDTNKEVVYYTAAENSPMERKLYSIDFKGNKKQVLTAEEGTHAITPITGYKFFLDKHSNLNTPPVYYLRDAKGKIVRTLEDNSELKNKMKDYNLGKIEFKKIELSDKTLNAWMITPPDFNENKKYPVLMFQYSGPGSQSVNDVFPVKDYFWHQMLAQKGYIIVCADGTGTSMRGQEFRKKTYLQLGKLESEDQIATAKYLGNLPYVDKSRIGIWGWSYGGFMSSTCLFKGADVFKMAIAVAPVSNWRYYDNIYTERYMRTPAENAKGYDENAPEKMVKNMKGKFLLIHGTGDDNVHFQNSIMLTEALIKANKEFDSEYYPDKAHGISGGNTRLHLYNRMTDFVLRNL